MEYEDYIIRVKDLENPKKMLEEKLREQEMAKKKVSRLRSFLGKSLNKPLVIDFSRDTKSSFTEMPSYKRHASAKDNAE